MSMFRRKPVEVLRDYESWEPAVSTGAGADGATVSQLSETASNQRLLDSAVAALDAAAAQRLK